MARRRSLTTITDLNDDCLMQIFQYLNYTDLRNVALSNANLRYSACQTYISNFNANMVIVCLTTEKPMAEHHYVSVKNFIRFDSIKATMLHLRCFGPATNLLVYTCTTRNETHYRMRCTALVEYIKIHWLAEMRSFTIRGLPSDSHDTFFNKVTLPTMWLTFGQFGRQCVIRKQAK